MLCKSSSARVGMRPFGRRSDRNLARDVALKRLSRQHSSSTLDHDLKEILSEATKHSTLVHHNIVQVYDIIEVDDEPLIVMEFVDGKSLYESLRLAIASNKPYPLEKAVALLRDVLEGVDHAHSHDVCHRDLTPMNILLTASGIPKIADFGIARVLKPQECRPDIHLPTSQGGTGNRDYMSPEQLREEPADFLSDLFMVGITGYLLLCGRHPFSHPSGLFAIEELIADADYLPETPKPPLILSDVQQRQFREYADIVMRLLHRERARRFASRARPLIKLTLSRPLASAPTQIAANVFQTTFTFAVFAVRISILRRYERRQLRYRFRLHPQTTCVKKASIWLGQTIGPLPLLSMKMHCKSMPVTGRPSGILGTRLIEPEGMHEPPSNSRSESTYRAMTFALACCMSGALLVQG